MDDLKLYTLDNISRLVGVSKTTLYRYVKDGKLQAVKIGKAWMITEEKLRAFIDRGTAPKPAAKRRTKQAGKGKREKGANSEKNC